MAYRKKRFTRGLSQGVQKRNKKIAHTLVKKLVRTRSPRAKKRIAKVVHKKIKYS